MKKLICDRFNFSDDTNVLVFTGDLSLQDDGSMGRWVDDGWMVGIALNRPLDATGNFAF